MLELGKSYQLADGSGTGTVVEICYWVKIKTSGRHNGEVPMYDANGKCVSALSRWAPDLLVEHSATGVKVVESPAF
jgi:hypothetical protein